MGQASHAKGQRLLGLDIIPDTHVGVSSSKPENAENGRLLHRWSPSGETMQEASNEDFTPLPTDPVIR